MFPWDKRPNPLKTFNKNPYTDAGVNFRIEQRRIADIRKREIAKYVHASDMANVSEECDRHVMGGRKRNKALRRAGEQTLEDHFKKRADAERLERRRQKDAKLASAMANIGQQQQKQEREVARICENDPSLRALKAKIQAAYMNKERVQQKKYQRIAAEKRKEEDIKFYKEAAENREGLLAKEKAKEQERIAFATVQRDQIQAQLRRNENEARLRKIQEFQAEKEHVNQILEAIQKEVEQEDREARQKMEDLNNMMNEGIRLRAKETERRRLQEVEEEKRIAAHKERVAHRNDSLIALKKAQAESKERIRLAIEAEALARQQAEDNMRAALDTLRKEEKEKLEEQKELEKARKKHEDKMMMMSANEQQKAEKRRRREQEKIEEANVVARMQEKFKQDDLKAQAKAHLHEELELDYKRDIHKQMKTRGEFFKAAKLEDQKQQRIIRENKAFRERVVEEARLAILREHAAKLKDFLPKGVFAKESDLEMLSVFDTDGDNVLSAAETRAAKDQLLAYGDANNDGRLDASERDRAFTRLRSSVDKDGDGRLSKAERDAARQLHTR